MAVTDETVDTKPIEVEPTENRDGGTNGRRRRDEDAEADSTSDVATALTAMTGQPHPLALP